MRRAVECQRFTRLLHALASKAAGLTLLLVFLPKTALLGAPY
jgi:hypothetical protein